MSRSCCDGGDAIGMTGNPLFQRPATRKSCLECVEKHIGAAWVLLAESRDGYAHDLRAIGHLHEAEDESQQWPELHEAIREARKGFQRRGEMPGWAGIAGLIEGVKHEK